MTYEEIVARAIHKRVLLQEHLDRVQPPFEQPAICWICTRDMWGYICSEAYGDVRASVLSDFSFTQDTIDIRYYGLPVHIRENASVSDEDKLFPAIVLRYIEQGFIDCLLPGMRILRNTSIFEVVEAPSNSNAVMPFGLILSGYAEDRAFSAGVYAGRIGTTETHQWHYRQTGISDEPIRVVTRAQDWERARDLYLRSTDPVFSQGTSSMEFRYGDSRMKRDILAGEWLGDLYTAELDDNFESADLSILFGTAPNE